jgi:hypothetical protein
MRLFQWACKILGHVPSGLEVGLGTGAAKGASSMVVIKLLVEGSIPEGPVRQALKIALSKFGQLAFLIGHIRSLEMVYDNGHLRISEIRGKGVKSSAELCGRVALP